MDFTALRIFKAVVDEGGDQLGRVHATKPQRAATQVEEDDVRLADGVVRPVIRGQILAGNGAWVSSHFLVDTGADRTVCSAGLLATLHLQPLPTPERLGGVGGTVTSVVVWTPVP